MTQLIIGEFTSYSKKMLREFFEIADDTDFAIIIPRDYVKVTEGDDQLMAEEFIYFAHAGDLLCQNVDQFAYLVPEPYSLQPVRFIVETGICEEFIDVFYHIIQGTDTRNNKRFSDFHEEAMESFHSFLDLCAITSCVGLMGVALNLVSNNYEKGDEI